MATGRDLYGHCRGGMGELRGVGQGLCSVWAGRARGEMGVSEPPLKEAWDLQTAPVAVAYGYQRRRRYCTPKHTVHTCELFTPGTKLMIP